MYIKSSNVSLGLFSFFINQYLWVWPFSSKSSKRHYSQTVRNRELKVFGNVYLPPMVTCHMSQVMCSVSCVTYHVYLISRPWQSQGLLYKHLRHSLINWFSWSWFVKITLQRPYAQIVDDCASSHKINYVNIFSQIRNLEGHLHRFIGSKVTAILVNGGILPTGGVASRRVCACIYTLYIYFFSLWRVCYPRGVRHLVCSRAPGLFTKI